MTSGKIIALTGWTSVGKEHLSHPSDDHLCLPVFMDFLSFILVLSLCLLLHAGPPHLFHRVLDCIHPVHSPPGWNSTLGNTHSCRRACVHSWSSRLFSIPKLACPAHTNTGACIAPSYLLDHTAARGLGAPKTGWVRWLGSAVMLGNRLYSFWGFPGGSDGKEPTCNAGDQSSIPGLGRSPGGGHGNPLQYSCLENPHGQRSLVGPSPWGSEESDTTEWQVFFFFLIKALEKTSHTWAETGAKQEESMDCWQKSC